MKPTKTFEERATETIADYKADRIKSFGFAKGRVWVSQGNLLEHLVRDKNSVQVLADFYRRKAEAEAAEVSL